MNKPLTIAIKETKQKIVSVCNESMLSPIILDLIMQGIYKDIHILAERQTLEEETAYMKMVEKASNDADVVNENTN